MMQQQSLIAIALLVLLGLAAASETQSICGLPATVSGLVKAGSDDAPSYHFENHVTFDSGSLKFRVLASSAPFSLSWFEMDKSLRAVVDSGSVFTSKSVQCDEVTIDFEKKPNTVYGLVARLGDGRVFRSLELTGPSDLMMAATVDDVTLVRVRHTDIAFTIENVGNRLARSLNEVEQLPVLATPAPLEAATCLPFNPDASDVIQMQYLSECRNYIPLGYSETVQWPTATLTRYYALPANWEVAPSTALGTREVVGNFSQYWNSATDCWASKAGCTDSWSYINNTNTGNLCVKVTTGAGTARPILRRLSVDTRCHLDNYNLFCNGKGASRISVGEIPLDTKSLFVNLRGGSVANMTFRLPKYTGTNPTASVVQLAEVKILDLLVLFDTAGYTATELNTVADTLFVDRLDEFAAQLQTAITSRGTVLNIAYRWFDGNVFRGMSGVKRVASLNAETDFLTPSRVPGATGSFLDAVNRTVNPANFLWNTEAAIGSTDYMRVAMIVTSANLGSYANYASMASNFQTLQIFPYVFTPTGNKANFASMITAMPWARTCSTCLTAFTATGFGSVAASNWPGLVLNDVHSAPVSATPVTTTTLSSILDTVYMYIFPNPPFLFFTPDKQVASGNDRIVLTVNDKCFCYPNIKGAPAPPPGFYYCDDPNMPCIANAKSNKIFICHVPPGNDAGGNTLDVSQTAWGGHDNHDRDGVGGCDCFFFDSTGGVFLSELPPESLYIMSPDHYYGMVYVFGHDSRKAYVTVPSSPWLPVNEQTITVDADTTVIFNFVEPPNMVIDQNGYLSNYQITYVGYSGVPPSINVVPLELKSYPSGTPISLSTSTSIYARICPLYNGTGISIKPPCNPQPLIIRYRLCNGCSCQKSGVDQISTLFIKTICKVEVPPYCTSVEQPTLWTYETTGNTSVVNLAALSGDGNNDPINVTVTGITGISGTTAATAGSITLFANGTAAYSVNANFNGTLTFTYRATDGKNTTGLCTVTIPVVRLLSAPQIILTPNLTFITPREVNSSSLQVYTLQVRYNPGQLVTLYASNGQWVDPAHIAFVYMSGSLEVRGIEIVNYFLMDSNYQDNTTLEWRPTQFHLDNGQSNVTFTAVAQDGATSVATTATFRVTPNIAPTSNNVAAPVTTAEDTAVAFTVRCTDVDWYHTYTLNIANTSAPANGVLARVGVPSNLTGYVGTAQSYTFTPNANWFGSTSFTYVCTDALGLTVTDTVTITVTAVNDPPTSQNYIVFIAEGTKEIFTIEGRDVDVTTDKLALSASNISLIGGTTDVFYQSPTLVATADNTWYNKTTATAFWTFEYTRPFGSTASNPEVFAFVVNDGRVSSAVYYVTFVLEESGPPTCQNVALTTAEDTQFSFSLNSYFGSTAGASLSDVSILTDLTTPIGGAIKFNSFSSATLTTFPSLVPKVNNVPGLVYFVPDSNDFGTTTFTYLVRDNTFNKTASSVCTVTITVTPVNDPPTLSITPLDATINRTQTATFTVTVTDIDSATVNVSWAEKSVPANTTLITSTGVTTANYIGPFTLTNGVATFTVTWTPSASTLSGASGFANFTAVDTQGLAAIAPFTDDRITFRVNVNLPPVHFSSNVPAIVEDQQVCGRIQIVGTDPDAVDRNIVQMQLVLAPAFGTINQTVAQGYIAGVPHPDGTQYFVCYTPNPNYNGEDFIDVQYRDQLGLVSEVTRIYIVVAPVNDAPTSKDINITLGWDQVASFSFTGSDIDGDVLRLIINANVASLTGGTVWYKSGNNQVTGARTFTTALDDWVFEYRSGSINVNETFTFVVNDGTVNSVTYTVYIMVDKLTNYVNQPPITWNGTYSTNEDTATTIDLDLHSVDDLDVHNITLVLRSPVSADTVGVFRDTFGNQLNVGQGSLAADGIHSVTFTPAADYCGPAIFGFRATDSAGLASNTSFININVVCVNDPPTWTVDPALINGVRTVASGFNYSIVDIDSATVTMRINATQLANFPAGSIFTINGALVPLNTDFSLTLQNPAPGTPITVQATWTPSASIPDGTTASFWASLVDASGLRAPDLMVTFTIVSNLPPVAMDFDITILENSNAVILQLLGTDPDAPHNKVLTVTLVANNGYPAFPQFGSFVGPFNATASYPAGTRYDISYTPNRGYFGNDVFYFTYTDLVGAVSNIARVNITIVHVNTAPECRNQTVRVQAGGNVTITLVGTDVDVNDRLGYTMTQKFVSKGSLYRLPGTSLLATGTINNVEQPWQLFYNTSLGDQGNYSFIYTVTDDYTTPLSSNGCNVTIIVSEGEVIIINNPPVPENLTIVIDEDTIRDFDFSQYITDPDGDGIIQIIIGQFPNSSLTSITNPDGSLVSSEVLVPSTTGTFPIVIVPILNLNGTTTIEYYAVDEKGDISLYPGIITIIINPVNDAPTISVTPLSVIIPRETTGSISFTINDIDSTVLTVTLLQNNVPVESTLVYGAAKTVVDQTSSIVYTHNTGSLPETMTGYFEWTPKISMVDFTSGNFQLQVSDGELTADSQIVTLSVLPNNPPFTTAPAECTNATEETAVDIVLMGTDPDVYDQTILDVVLLSLPFNGVLSVNGTVLKVGDAVRGTAATAATELTVTYTPNQYFRGSDSFDFAVRDSQFAISVARTVCINIVNLVDHPPTGSNLTLTVLEDYCLNNCGDKTINPLFVEIVTADVDQDDTFVRFNTVPTTGTLYVFDGTTLVVITPGSTFNLDDFRVYYQPPPGVSGTPFETVDFTVLSNVTWMGEIVPSVTNYTLTINVLAVNDPPTGANATYVIDMNEEITFTLVHEDIDNDADTLIIELVDIPTANRGVFRENATADAVSSGRLDGFNLTFTPTTGAYDTEAPIATFTYRVRDPDGGRSELYTVNVLVGFVPFNITFENRILDVDEDSTRLFQVDRYNVDYFGGNEGLTAVTINVSNIVKTFPGTLSYCNGDLTVCVEITGPTSVPPGSTFTYTGGQDLFGNTAVTFDVTLNVSTGAPAQTRSITINVIPVNDPPVLVPKFNLTTAVPPSNNKCDEDTFIVLDFEATDIDNTPAELSGDLIQFLFGGAPGRYYNCDGNSNSAVDTFGTCKRGTVLTPGQFVPIDTTTDVAKFSFLFIPAPNVVGKARLLLQVVDPLYASSQKEIVEIEVQPINDAPMFEAYDVTLGKVDNSTFDKLTITSTVKDLDFMFGYNLSVTYTLLKTTSSNSNDTASNSTKRQAGNSSNTQAPQGYFVVPETSTTGDVPPCVLASDRLSIVCNHKVEKVNPWLGGGIDLVVFEGVLGAIIELNVNDLGNIDKNPGMPLNTSVFLTPTFPTGALVGATKPPTDNVALIAAPIAGLIAGALIAGLIFFIKKEQAAAAVENYFDRFALGMEGATNASPLYQGATKGGASAIYVPKT